MPSLSKMRERYFLMVCSLRLSSRATSRLLKPSATRATTCSARGVSSLIPRELTMWSEGTWLKASITYCNCSLSALLRRDWKAPGGQGPPNHRVLSELFQPCATSTQRDACGALAHDPLEASRDNG